jgi:hypothetical protein
MSGLVFVPLTDKELAIILAWGRDAGKTQPEREAAERTLYARLVELRNGVACKPGGSCSDARCSVPRTNDLRSEAWGHGEANST